MIQALTILVEHPLTFGFIILCFLGFVGMTYEFILRLFKRNSLHDELKNKLDMEDKDDIVEDEQTEPPEPANVPVNDPPPDTLVAEEQIPEEEYEFNPDWDKQQIHSDWHLENPYYEEQEEKANEKELTNGR